MEESSSYPSQKHRLPNLNNKSTELHRYLRSIARAAKRRITKSTAGKDWITGLPPGLLPEFLDQICQDVKNKPLGRVKFKHLSGWKESGAYRLEINLGSGHKWYLIYKDANYHTDQLPALKGLPYQPGPPEYTVFNNPPPSLAAFLPHCYWAEETEPACHYRYLFEDLADEFTRIRGVTGLLNTVEALYPLQEALQSWTPEPGCKLLHLDQESARALQGYVHEMISRYQQERPTPVAEEFLQLSINCPLSTNGCSRRPEHHQHLRPQAKPQRISLCGLGVGRLGKPPPGPGLFAQTCRP